MVWLLSACNSSQPPLRAAGYDGLPTAGRESARINDPVIMADRRFIAGLQTRLGKLNTSGVAAKNYHLTKAGAWIDFATEEYSDNDRGGIVEAALEQALLLVRAMEVKEPNLPLDTPIIKGSQRVREDLWALVTRYKREREFDCIADRVAKLEVQLVWAGHEDLEGGWRHAKPYIEIAEDMVGGIDAALRVCGNTAALASTASAAGAASAAPVGPAQAPGSSAPAQPDKPQPADPQPAKATKPIEPVNESVTLSADALFRFDGSASADILPTGRAQLDALVARLKGLARIERVLVTGHSDRLGDAPYNLRLSQARAQTVRLYLIEHGIAGAQLQAAGAGESEPLVTCNGDRALPALVECLQPNRRVEVRIVGVRTRGGQP